MATLHLVSGLPCAGKTTYSHSLRARREAVLFTLDVWLITLFGRYDLERVGQEEHTRRVLACRELTWTSTSELLFRGTDVILDDGFFLREHRSRYVQRAAALGVPTMIHFLDIALPVLEQRLRQRNASLPAFNFEINPETLTAFVGIFERPSEDEGAELVVARNPDDARLQ